MRSWGMMAAVLLAVSGLLEGRPGQGALQLVERRAVEQRERELVAERRTLEAGLDAALAAMGDGELAEIERASQDPADWDGMLGDAPALATQSNDTAKSVKDSWDPVIGRDKEQRIKNIREQVLRFLGRKDNKNFTQPNEHQARILQIISQIKIDKPWPSTEVYTELSSFYPSCDLPRNTDEEAWDKGLQMNLFFNLNFSSPGKGSTSIQYAKLKLFKLPQGNTTMPLTEDYTGQAGGGELGEKKQYLHFPATSSVLPIEEKQIRVSVYWYTRGLRKHRAKRKLLDSQMISLYGESWTEYNVKGAVKSWKELGKNFGISVEVEDEDRVILQASKIFVMMNCSKEASVVQPIPSAALEGLDNNTREVLRPLSPLYPSLELSTREFPDSEVGGYPKGGVRLESHHLRHHHSTDIPPINDTMVGGFQWEDPRHQDLPAHR